MIKTPLEDRIARWVMQNMDITRIVLHPDDYDKMSPKTQATLENAWQLPIVRLEGNSSR